jgi:molybdenum cofactor cytidylyltransferase
MGSPKALLRYRGRSFVDHLIATFQSAGAHVIVVLGHHSAGIRAAAALEGADVVENPAPQRGQLSSLQCGLARIPESTQAIAFTLVDLPAIAPSTIESLTAAFDTSRALLALPAFRGKRGHPVVFRRTLLSEFLALPEGAAARDVVRRYSAETAIVDVDDPGVVSDVDTPEDYARLISEAAHDAA